MYYLLSGSVWLIQWIMTAADKTATKSAGAKPNFHISHKMMSGVTPHRLMAANSCGMNLFALPAKIERSNAPAGLFDQLLRLCKVVGALFDAFNS
jgi:hypothetical protein